ncbi:MAG: hypothetical protein ACOYN2_03675 [Patescibacteria group bacterium]
MLRLVDKTGPPPGSASAQAIDDLSGVIGDYVARSLFHTGIEHRLPENVTKNRTVVNMRLGLPEDSAYELRKQFIINVNLRANYSTIGNFYVNATVPGVLTDEEAFASIIVQLLKSDRGYCQALADEMNNQSADEAFLVESLSSLHCGKFEYYIGAITIADIHKAA